MADDLRHRCGHCDGIDPGSCVFAPGGADELRRGYAERTVEQWRHYSKHWRERVEKAERVIARVENLRDKWLAWPTGDMHYAAGLMLAKYLSDEPPALDDTAGKPHA